MRAWIAVLLLTLAGCSCGEEAALRVEGPTPHVRCYLAAAEEREWTVGSVRLRVEGRALQIDGLESPYRFAVATGPLAPPPDHAAFVVVLGGVDALDPLEDFTRPVLLIAGGSDRWDEWGERIESDANEGVVDATVLRSIRIGRLELIPVAGAPDGRYAASNGCCGLSGDVAEAWALPEADDGVHRLLLSWAAPEARGLLGASSSSPRVAAIAEEVGAEESIFAFPRESERAIRPASGPWITRGDGSRVAPGWTLFEVGADGAPTRLDLGEGPD